MEGDKRITVDVPPGVWAKIEKELSNHNNNPKRTSPKRKIVDVVNDALLCYYAMKEGGDGAR